MQSPPSSCHLLFEEKPDKKTNFQEKQTDSKRDTSRTARTSCDRLTESNEDHYEKEAGMVRQIGLIGVPSSAGAHWPGQEKAPQALRAAGLLEQLRQPFEPEAWGRMPRPLALDKRG